MPTHFRTTRPDGMTSAELPHDGRPRISHDSAWYFFLNVARLVQRNLREHVPETLFDSGCSMQPTEADNRMSCKIVLQAGKKFAAPCGASNMLCVLRLRAVRRQTLIGGDHVGTLLDRQSSGSTCGRRRLVQSPLRVIRDPAEHSLCVSVG